VQAASPRNKIPAEALASLHKGAAHPELIFSRRSPRLAADFLFERLPPTANFQAAAPEIEIPVKEGAPFHSTRTDEKVARPHKHPRHRHPIRHGRHRFHHHRRRRHHWRGYRQARVDKPDWP
jgi:hypothetical protein